MIQVAITKYHKQGILNIQLVIAGVRELHLRCQHCPTREVHPHDLVWPQLPLCGPGVEGQQSQWVKAHANNLISI